VSCKICERESVKEGFCEFHYKAKENLVNMFDLWRKALNISWKEYLSQVAENSSAGNWVKEVAKYLIENGET
jgi:hypothetical protein